MKKELLKQIQSRLNEFKNLSPEEQYQEFLFCLLTPQSKAQRCWQAVLELSQINSPSLPQITKILSTKTRFHHTKAKRILSSPQNYKKVLPLLSNPNKLELRNSLSSQVSGYGLKEASHFLRNIGHSDNQIAILDRHILKNLHQLSLIKESKISSPKNYLEIEQIFLSHAKSINIPPDVLDLLLWSKENGEIFK
jgi:N-glycosylase/DNA lyase